MKLPDRTKILNGFKYVFLIVIILEVMSAIEYYFKICNINLTQIQFWLGVLKTIATWFVLYLLVYFFYKPEK